MEAIINARNARSNNYVGTDWRLKGLYRVIDENFLPRYLFVFTLQAKSVDNLRDIGRHCTHLLLLMTKS